MTLTKMQAMLGVATGILVFGGIIAGDSVILEKRFAALDTRLGKLESAVKAINAEGPDEKYRQLVKELMAEKSSGWTPAPGQNYLRFDSTTHSAVCSRNGGPEVPCDITDKQAKELGMRFGKSEFPSPSLKDGGNTWDTFPATAGAAGASQEVSSNSVAWEEENGVYESMGHDPARACRMCGGLCRAPYRAKGDGAMR